MTEVPPGLRPACEVVPPPAPCEGLRLPHLGGQPAWSSHPQVTRLAHTGAFLKKNSQMKMAVESLLMVEMEHISVVKNTHKNGNDTEMD